MYLKGADSYVGYIPLPSYRGDYYGNQPHPLEVKMLSLRARAENKPTRREVQSRPYLWLPLNVTDL